LKKQIRIFGAGGLGREIAAMIRAMADWEVIGFYDDNAKPNTLIDGYPFLGTLVELLSVSEAIDVVVAIGDPRVKSDILSRLKENQFLKFPSLVDPSAKILDPERVTIGPGAILAAGCILTTGISIGAHTLVNLNTTIGHDSRIGDRTSIMPGVNMAGNVRIGNGVLIGSGANILNGVTVGDGAKIGAGSVVLSNVPAGITVVGVPARESVKT
jgi:sugar O-acyltransferase (sialic acid O-acetyltransferase NeuD family)